MRSESHKWLAIFVFIFYKYKVCLILVIAELENEIESMNKEIEMMEQSFMRIKI